jgi:hypothetical protein
MEQFFTPTRRYQDLFELDKNDDGGPSEYTEVELAVPLEDFLSYPWDWEDLRAFVTGDVGRKIMWISKDALLDIEERGNVSYFDYDSLSDRITAKIQTASGQEQELVLIHLDHPEISTGEAGVFWRAVATSNSVKVRIDDDDNRLGLPSGPLLSQFMRGSPSLQGLVFQGFDFKEEHCRALTTLQRTDLDVTFSYCTFQPQDTDTFVEWFRHSQVVTELDCCDKEEISSLLLQALPGNTGIEHLIFSSIEMSDETWSLLFRSLSTHPRIKLLFVRNKWMASQTSLSAESKSIWMNAILRMLHLNTDSGVQNKFTRFFQ